MDITYVNSNDNAVKSQLAFHNLLSPKWKVRLILRSLIIFTLLLIFLLYKGYKLEMGFTSDGIYYPTASLIVNLIWSIPASIFMAWLAYRIPVVSQENAIIVYYRGFPADYFGQNTFSFNQEGISVKAPLYEQKDSWKMIDSIKQDNDFIFFCIGNHLIFSIPKTALDSQPSTFIAQIENLMTNYQLSASTETKL